MVIFNSQNWFYTAFFVLFVGISTLHAQNSAQAIFDKANEAFQENDYQTALQLYHQLEDQNFVSGPLYLNMALSYTRMDSLGVAKYYYLKASRFEETATRADSGLGYVDDQFSRTPATLPQLPWEEAVEWLRINIGALNLLIWALIFINAGVIMFLTTWFIRTRYNKWISIVGRSLAMTGIVVLLTSFYVHYIDDRYSQAVMIEDQTSVREEASSNASVVSQAYEGYTFTVDHKKSSTNNWSYVRMSNGQYGWIPNDDILIL